MFHTHHIHAGSLYPKFDYFGLEKLLHPIAQSGQDSIVPKIIIHLVVGTLCLFVFTMGRSKGNKKATRSSARKVSEDILSLVQEQEGDQSPGSIEGMI